MKEQAAQLLNKLEQRNKLVGSPLELEIKLLMNKITPSTFTNLKKKLTDIMQNNDYKREVLEIILLAIFNKACIEEKYTTMYSELSFSLIKRETSYISKLFESDYQKFMDIYKKDKKDEKPKKDQKLTSKDAKKFSVLKSELLNHCRVNIHKLGSEIEVDEDDSDKDEKIAKHRDKIMGNVRFIGTLYNIDILQADLTLNIISNYLISP